MENKVIAKFNGNVTVEECVSRKGTPYKAVFIVVNGEKVQIGFVNVYTELAFVRAGVKL